MWESTKILTSSTNLKEYPVCKFHPLKILDSSSLTTSLTWNMDQNLNFLVWFNAIRVEDIPVESKKIPGMGDTLKI